jgi:hypothetical protein
VLSVLSVVSSVLSVLSVLSGLSLQDPFGPYTYVGNLNPKRTAHHLPGQNSDVIEVTLKNGTVAYLWSSDLWFSSQNEKKGSDLQYWEPLTWVVEDVGGGLGLVPVPKRSKEGEWVACYRLELPDRVGKDGGGGVPCKSELGVGGGGGGGTPVDEL